MYLHGNLELPLIKALLPLNSTVAVTVTFDSSCLVQQYRINALSGIIPAAPLCNVATHPFNAAVLVGQQYSLTCITLSNAIHSASITFIRDGNRVSPKNLPLHFSITAARQEDTGDYIHLHSTFHYPAQPPVSGSQSIEQVWG